MKDENLETLAVDTLHSIKEAQRATGPYNDFGSALGFIDEQRRIEDELRACLLGLRCRAGHLAMRVKKYEKGDVKAAKL